MKRTNTTSAGGSRVCPEPLRFKPAIEAGAKKLEVRPATTAGDIAQCQEWFGEEHYLGPVRAAGDRLHQIVLEDGRPVAVLLWAASAWHLKDRDDWIGWDPLTRACRLKLVVSNWRYLVLEETRRPNLASQCLAAALRALPAQWEAQYSYRPVLAESFTDPESHAGTCYKASGWTAVGMSKGFARHRCEYYVPNDRPKKLWVRELVSGKGGKAGTADARELLCARELPAIHAGGETGGGGARSVLKAAQLRSLALVFREIPDPRTRASMRYPLFSVLTITAMALLGGAVHISEICRAGQRLDQKQRAQIGLRKKAGTKFYPAPGYSVYRNLLLTLDVAKMAEVFNGWLGENIGSLPRSLALDGKTITDKLGQMVSLVDGDGTPVAMACNNKGKELPTAQELLDGGQANLINATVGADALHCQHKTARAIVTGGGDYTLRVEANQPNLLKGAEKQIAGTPPLFRKPKKATGASRPGSCTPARSKPRA
jgi:hypothetical protein